LFAQFFFSCNQSINPRRLLVEEVGNVLLFS